MRILRKKNINAEAVADVKVEPAQVDLEPVIDHTTANTIASKEANEEAAEANIKASGIEEVAKEVVDEIQDPKKDTPAPKTPSLKPYTEAKQVANRKELGSLIRESVEAGRVYKVKRSDQEGFRYVFEDFEKEYPECYFVAHSDEDANNENGYFDSEEEAKAFAESNPEICCIFKVCGNEEEKVWERPVEECIKEDVDARPHETKLHSWIEGGLLDYKTVAEAFMTASSDDAIADLIREYGWDEFEHVDESKEKTNECSEVKEEVQPSVCPECGKEPCECKKEEVTEAVVNAEATSGNLSIEGEVTPEIESQESVVISEEKEEEVTPAAEPVVESKEEEHLDEAIVAPVSEPGDDVDPEEVPVVEITPEVAPDDEVVAEPEAEVSVAEVVPEEDPEIEIDSIETFEPSDEKAKSTMTTIKDAGEGAMFAFKDTLKDLFNLKIKVSDLQKLLSDSSDWLLDLLGFNHDSEEEVVIAPEEIPEPVEEPAPVEDEFDEVEPIGQVSTLDINGFDDVEPVEYGEEDEKFFVED